MDNWDNDFLDLVEEAHLDFKGATDRWDCQEFRVQAGIMGRKESHYVPTQRAFDTE
jgi:hypothetical protein